MSRIKVKAVPGRVARTSRYGDFIPSDQFVSVERSPYINRLLNVHGDIVEEPAKPVAKPAASKPTAVTADKKVEKS